MRIHHRGVTVLLAALPVLAPQQAERTLTPEQMEEDLTALTGAFLSLHAGRTRYTPEEELDEVLGEALFEISEDRTELEFYRIVAGIVSAVRCGHTRVLTTDALERAALADGLLPFDVHLNGDRAWVLTSYDEQLAPGAEINRIDGRSIADIRATAFARMPADGFIETGKERRLKRQFARLYALLVQEPETLGGGHVIELAGAEAAKLPMKLTGLSLAELRDRRAPRPRRPLMTVTLVPEQDLGVVMVSEFGDRAGEEPFPDQLEQCFVKLNESGVRNLVVDLRGNGGGNDDYGALLVSYMATRKFGYFERIEVTEDYDGPGGIVEKDGLRLVTRHRSLDPWEPAEHRFRGEVYLLEDGWTFSTAADVATVAHHNGFATLVGEESGGGYDGNTSGSSERIRLANSGLTVNVPMWMYTTANVGHQYPGRGAIPHHALRPTIEDTLAGRDAELARVLELIRE